jgi:hypothetical protein
VINCFLALEEVREVKSKVLMLTVALFAIVFLASSIAPALATTYPVTYVEITKAGGDCHVEVPGQPKISMMIQKFDRSSDHGVRERLWIGLYNPVVNAYAIVAVLTDGSDSDFFKEVWANPAMPGGGQLVAANTVVKPWDITICRIGKLIIACWTKPIEGVLPAPLKTALGIESWTLPPGVLILKGYGEVDTAVSTIGPLPSGYTVTMEPNNYAAKGTFFCPSWRFCGPVSDARISTQTVMTVHHD